MKEYEILRRFKERQLTKEVVIPLLEYMEFKDVIDVHGQNEHGIDIIFYEDTKFGNREYTGVQVKKRDIHGNAGKSGNATVILTQAQQAFSYIFTDCDNNPKNILSTIGGVDFSGHKITFAPSGGLFADVPLLG
jgi:hypothetical protein